MKKKWLFRLLGILFIFIFVGYIFVYETYLHGKLSTTKVVVATNNIESYELLTEENTYLSDYPRELVTEDTLLASKDVIGKRAAHDISANDPFTKKKVMSSKLRSEENERYFSIPSSWLVSVPGSLRRLDEVDIWLTRVAKEPLTQTFSTEKPLLEKKVVAYLKSSNNVEVTGVGEASNRLDAINNPSRIELGLTDEEFNELKKAVESGYGLIISY